MAKRNTTAAKSSSRGGGGAAGRNPNMRAFLALSDEEKDAEFAKMSRVVPLAETTPLTADERRRWDAATGGDPAKAGPAKRKAGRPRVGQGYETVSVSVEKGLLKRADAYAKAHRMKRTELVAVGLRLAMASSATAANKPEP